VHPDILQKMIGHFYRRKGDTWVAKRKAAFMQTPQVGARASWREGGEIGGRQLLDAAAHSARAECLLLA
jgi:hypothetical protein